jgi:3-hydroxy-3-methylglutaryl CoA synthase
LRIYTERFRVINSDTKDSEDLQDAISLLANESTLGSGAVAHYIKENKDLISVYDDDVKAYLETLYPDIFEE